MGQSWLAGGGLSNIFLKGDLPKTVSAKLGKNWPLWFQRPKRGRLKCEVYDEDRRCYDLQ